MLLYISLYLYTYLGISVYVSTNDFMTTLGFQESYHACLINFSQSELSNNQFTFYFGRQAWRERKSVIDTIAKRVSPVQSLILFKKLLIRLNKIAAADLSNSSLTQFRKSPVVSDVRG